MIYLYICIRICLLTGIKLRTCNSLAKLVNLLLQQAAAICRQLTAKFAQKCSLTALVHRHRVWKYCLHSEEIPLREAPIRLAAPLFGHCPNSDYTPPAPKRALWGTFFPGRFEQICQITVLTVHKCTKHPGKP